MGPTNDSSAIIVLGSWALRGECFKWSVALSATYVGAIYRSGPENENLHAASEALFEL